MNYYGNGYGNPYYGQQFNMQVPQQPIQQPIQQPMQQVQQVQQPIQQANFVKPSILQGKVVDSIDVVKATEIPYDYSVSYFPLTDGSAIVTKQLQNDGTTRISVYKPVPETDEQPKVEYITKEEFKETVGKLDFSDDLKNLKRNVEDLNEDFKKFKSKKD